MLSAARTDRPWLRTVRQTGSANASSACRRRLSRGTIQQTRSMRSASISRAAAITGSSDLPPPGVTAARMSHAVVSPAAIAATKLARRCWWVRSGRGDIIDGNLSHADSAVQAAVVDTLRLRLDGTVYLTGSR